MILIICISTFLVIVVAALFSNTHSNQWQDPELDDDYVDVDLIIKKFKDESESSQKDNS